MPFVRRTALTVTVAALSAATLVAVAPAAQADVGHPRPSTIAVGGWNSFLVSSTGTLQGAGFNDYGALGVPHDGNVTALRTLAQLPNGAKPVAVDSVASTLVVVGDDGRVYGSGANFGAQLTYDSPTMGPNLADPWRELAGLTSGAIDVSVTQSCVAVLTREGKIFRTGNHGNDFGQCPLAAGADPNVLTEMPGIPTGRKAAQIALSGSPDNAEYMVVLLDNGDIYGTGGNGHHQLVGTTGNQTGLVALSPLPGDPSPVPTSIAADFASSFVIDSDGNAYGAGYNAQRKLTVDPASDVTTWHRLSGLPSSVKAVQMKGLYQTTVVLGDDGDIYAAGDNRAFFPQDEPSGDTSAVTLGAVPKPAGIGTITEIDSTGYSLVARGNHGYVWGVGLNVLGQLTSTEEERWGLHLLSGQLAFATVQPTIIGRGRYGSVFTSTSGSWTLTPSSFSYQWLRSGVPIIGATRTTYVPRKADTGLAVAIAVTAHFATSPDATATSDYRDVAPQVFNHGRPRVKGIAKMGKKLSIRTRGTWNVRPSTYSYRWLRNGAPIGGAIKKTYQLKKADKKKRITVRVTARRSGYVPGTAVSANYRRP